MALPTQTLHVRLDGGMADDTDDFQIPTTGNELVKNGVFYKDGTIRKRFGNQALSSISPTPAGIPKSLFALGDNLYTTTSDAVLRYNGTSWETIQNNFVPAVELSKNFSSSASEEQRKPAFVTNGSGLFWTCLQQRDSLQQGNNVVATLYDDTGRVVATTTIEGAFAPKVIDTGLTGVALFYVKESDNNLYLRKVQFDGTIGSEVNVSGGSPIAVDWDCITSTHRFQYNGDSLTSVEGHYQVVNGATRAYVVFAEPVVGTTSNTLTVRQYDDGFFTFLGTFPSQVPPGIGTYSSMWPMALALDDTNDLLYIMSGIIDGDDPGVSGDTNQQQVRIDALDSVGATVQQNTIYSSLAQPNDRLGVVNFNNVFEGDILIRSDLSLVVAFSARVSDDEFQALTSLWRTLGPIGLLEYGTLPGGTTPGTPLSTYTNTQILGHRLTGNLVELDSQIYGQIQPYVDGENFVDTNSALLDFRTNKVVRFDLSGGRPAPVAVTDPLTSALDDKEINKTSTHLQTTAVVGSDLVVFNREIETPKFQIASSTFSVSKSRANMYTVSFSPDVKPAIEGPTGVLVTSGSLLWFDGQEMLEVSPLDTPHINFVKGVDSGGDLGNLNVADSSEGGAKNMVAALVLGYEDANGAVHRSAPSPSLNFSADMQDTAEDAERARFYFTPPISVKSSNDLKYFVELYLSTNSDSTLKLLETRKIDLNALSSLDDVYIEAPIGFDNAPYEPVVLSGEILYTEGGEVAAEIPPSFKASVKTSERVFAVSAQDPHVVYYSKLFQDGIAPEFSGSLITSFGEGTNITAIGSMDDKIIVFEADATHVIYGPGPNNTTQVGQFAVQQVSGEIGCVSVGSVVAVPQGLMFQSRRGIHILDRALNFTYIGGPVEDLLVGANVIDAQVVQEYGEVRFLTIGDGTGTIDEVGNNFNTFSRPPIPKYGNSNDGATALVYNYERNKWSLFKNYEAQASTLYQGKYTRIKFTWDVWQETETNWTDPTGDNLLSITTPWYNFGGTQEFARLKKINILGRYMSEFLADGTGDLDAGDLRVDLAFNYEPFPESRDNVVWSADEELFPLVQDSSIRSPHNMQVRLTPRLQKIQSVQLTLSERETGTGFRIGRGFELSALSFDVGTRPRGRAKSFPKTNKGRHK